MLTALGLSLNTVKRYARASEPGRMIRAPRYRPTLVDPYRDHLRARRAQDPAVPVHQLLTEIREQGYRGSMNLLYRYITQGRVEADRPQLSPKRVARLLLTRPAALSDSQRLLLAGHQDQDDQEANVWPGRLNTPPPPDPAQLTATDRHHRMCDRAECATEPLYLQSLASRMVTRQDRREFASTHLSAVTNPKIVG